MLIKNIIFKFSENFYPVISRIGDHEPLLYHQYYIEKSKKLKIDRINYKQVTQETLIKLLRQQITDDKMLFHKEKQILFVGRSNTGKSSLINSIFNQKIARVAKSAGTTKFMHFHGLHNFQGTLIDSPGYGFAHMNTRRRNMWFGSTYQYLKVSSRVSQIMMCVNTQHGLKPNDFEFLSRCHKLNINIQVILTKSDKVKPQKLYYKMVSICQELNSKNYENLSDKVIAVSSKTQFGIPQMRYMLSQSLIKSQQRNIDQHEDLLLQYLKQNKVKPIDIKEKSQKKLSKPYLIKKMLYNSKLTKFLV